MGAEKSLVVMGKTLEATLDKAAIVLHYPKERIAYEILQEPRRGRYEEDNLPCKLRVTPVAPAADEIAPHGALTDEERLLHVTLPLTLDVLAALPCAVFLHRLEEAERSEGGTGETPPDAPLAIPETAREIVGDMGLATGSIHHVGDLHISGSIRKGTTVRASGAVHIAGDVETAFVDAGGDITIGGGLLGTARSARGSITCHFAQGAHIDAVQGDVRVQESAMHTQIHAGGEASIGGILLGGACYGERLVEARVAGSPTEVPTVIIAGRNARLYEDIERVRLRAHRHIDRLGECERARLELLPSEQAGTALAGPERARLWQATVRRARLGADLANLTQKKGRLLGMINETRGARVCVEGLVYPHVRVSVDDAVEEVQVETQFATFSKDADTGELRVTPLR